MSTTIVKRDPSIANFRSTINDPAFKFTEQQKVKFFHKNFPKAHLEQKNLWICPINRVCLHIAESGVDFKLI